ncbi:MAG: hypothetical protein LBG06_02050 [Deltaproteobacteria bacterium]|jgi:hypothetical protein|nr:hypothetical protein [Deltaproteobacteria bacterium]
MREPRAVPSFDRLWRLTALFALCGLIYYFSFDNGRQTSRDRVTRLQEQTRRLEAENESLRLQLALQGRELEALRPGAGEGGASPGDGGEAGISGGAAAAPAAAPPAPSALPPPAASRAPGQPPSPPAMADPEIQRLAIRNDENRLILGSQILLSVGGIDSLDKTAVVKVHELDTERRETRIMQPGDSFVIARGGVDHRLLLDQLKGSLAMFVLISP